MASTWPRCFSVGSNRGRPVAAIVSLSKNYTRLHAGPSPSRESLAQQYTTINDGCQYLWKPTLARAATMRFLGPVAHVLTPDNFRLSGVSARTYREPDSAQNAIGHPLRPGAGPCPSSETG